jgi:hypothetical protein
MRDSIPEKDIEELKKLYRELPPLVWEASVAIKPDPASRAMTGPELERFRSRDAAVCAVLQQIRQIVDA